MHLLLRKLHPKYFLPHRTCDVYIKKDMVITVLKRLEYTYSLASRSALNNAPQRLAEQVNGGDTCISFFHLFFSSLSPFSESNVFII